MRGRSGSPVESRGRVPADCVVSEADIHLREMFMERPAKYNDIIQRLSGIRGQICQSQRTFVIRFYSLS